MQVQGTQLKSIKKIKILLYSDTVFCWLCWQPGHFSFLPMSIVKAEGHWRLLISTNRVHFVFLRNKWEERGSSSLPCGLEELSCSPAGIQPGSRLLCSGRVVFSLHLPLCQRVSREPEKGGGALCHRQR